MNKFDTNNLKFHSQSDVDKVVESSRNVKKSDLSQYKKDCEKWSVVTTIFHPTEAIVKQATLHGWCLVVVADLKSPVDFRSSLFGELGENRTATGHNAAAVADTDTASNSSMPVSSSASSITYENTVVTLSADDQNELAKHIPYISALPWNSFARKNVGYFYATLHGAKYVWDFDDDNLLTVEDLVHKYTDLSVSSLDVLAPYSYDEVKKMKLDGDHMDPFKSVQGNVTSVSVTSSDHSSGNVAAPPIFKNLDSLIGNGGVRHHRGGSRHRGTLENNNDRRLTKADIDETAKHFTISFNPYPLMGAPYLPSWPRGLPMEDIKISSKTGDMQLYYHTNIKMTKIGVIQSLADNDPDVDALYRLVQPLPFSFKESMKPCLVPSDRLAPYNAQATLFYYNTLWSLILPTTVHGRVADIWRSYITMRLCRELDIHLVFSPPMVIQIRNAHDYLADFDAEDDLYKRSGTLVKQLSSWQPSTTTLPGMIEELWIYLYERDYFGLDDVILLQKWIEALMIIGYEFPTPISQVKSGKT